MLIAVGPVSAEEIPRHRYAMIVQNVGAGLAREMRELLVDSGWDENNILCYGLIEPSSSYTQFCIDGPQADAFLDGFDSIAEEITDRDTLLIVFICHMAEGCLINDSLPGVVLNERLARLPDETTVALILEGCHTMGHLPVLTAADLVFASAGADQHCYGGWTHFFLDALGKENEAFDLSDMDGNGFVSFGEAYDYAADEDRLIDWYDNLSSDVWPSYMPDPIPSRTDADLQYYFFLDESPVVF